MGRAPLGLWLSSETVRMLRQHRLTSLRVSQPPRTDRETRRGSSSAASPLPATPPAKLPSGLTSSRPSDPTPLDPTLRAEMTRMATSAWHAPCGVGLEARAVRQCPGSTQPCKQQAAAQYVTTSL